ncbi:cobyric acid synthase [uncultured Desulfovibrio sp.]|uniref:cobyric acid synthase n=1 Tax=uncultured Desulfovibrio sp. TaxID=167968 RepID=UPI002614FCE2|nr:cobyric acid synthase [uncultured Desulfovibrio sp.]
MKADAHGGDRHAMSRTAGRDASSLLDFSVNVRPEGMPAFLQGALLRHAEDLGAYPSPHAEEARDAAARRHGLPADRFVFGNGSNELIHALARALKRRGLTQACVVEPAFSEYALACRRAGIALTRIQDHAALCLPGRPCDGPALDAALASVPRGSALFLANPGNPSGLFRPREVMCRLLEQRPDLLWIIDEAFIEYAGPDEEVSLLARLPEHVVVLRSLTKFHALPGLRLGYLAAPRELAAAVQEELPAWNVNALALAAAVAALDDTSSFAAETRARNAARRQDLVTALSALPGVEVLPSAANYVLFRCAQAPADLNDQLLRRYGMAVRDCANYHGMEKGGWFRAAVRFPQEHARLARALAAILPGGRPAPAALAPSRRQTPALMVQGTSSSAGKSLLAAAFCRILRQDGYDVAPFKAQNMSLNSGVTARGEEMGRAQIVQAQAAGVDPDARMNPLLLKPHSQTGSQVILLGKPLGHMGVRDYFCRRNALWQHVASAYDSLAAEHQVMVLEGAGSPGEINLKQHDMVNMRMARHAGASVLLVGDIDRGGVYAAFLGTWLTFTAEERRLLHGYVVNRFRGDASLLAPAHDFMLQQTGVPVLGVIPYIPRLRIPEEDMAGFSWEKADPGPAPQGVLDIAVIMLPHVSNFTDFAPLAMEPDVRLRPVRQVEDWGHPHVVMLPGSKSVVNDLLHLRQLGLDQKILDHAAQGKWLFGICGGLQIMGRTLSDPDGVESAAAETRGLGILDLHTTFAARKTLKRVLRVHSPLGVPTGGYEIHHGRTIPGPEVRPLFVRCDAGNPEDHVCGYGCRQSWATYLHGVFDDDAFRRAWLDHVRAQVGLAPQGRQLASYDLEKELDRLADVVREQCDMAAIYRTMGLK